MKLQAGYCNIEIWNDHSGDWEDKGIFYEPQCNTKSEVKEAMKDRFGVTLKKNIRVTKESA